MTTHIGLGIAAGLVGALLFSVVATGSPLGIVLLYLAPLPLLIVGIGWHHLVALLALAVGALATTAFLRPAAGLAFAMGPALPAWWLSYLVLLLRPVRRGEAEPVEWLPIGHLLFWSGACGAIVALVSSIAIGGGDYAEFRGTLSRLVESFLRLQMGLRRDAPLPDVAGWSGAEFVGALVAVAPAVLALGMTLVLAANVWSASRVVAISGRLARPWPDIPSIRLPVAALTLLGAGALLAILPGFAGVAGAAILGAGTLAFALQGLALLHDVSRGRHGRGLLLASAYVLALLFAQAVVPLLALIGIADTATAIRPALKARVGGRSNPPPPPAT